MESGLVIMFAFLFVALWSKHPPATLEDCEKLPKNKIEECKSIVNLPPDRF